MGVPRAFPPQLADIVVRSPVQVETSRDHRAADSMLLGRVFPDSSLNTEVVNSAKASVRLIDADAM